ncbi:MAG: beta-mannanase [Chloroflexi bacterium]|nr:beta-mannanase [Chloroflexota bacterium]
MARNIAYVVLIVGFVLANSSPASGATSPVRKTSAAGACLGVWQPGAPWDMTGLARFESAVGKSMAIVMWYQGWGAANAPFDATILRAVADRGSIPLITWEPWDYTGGVDQPTYANARIVAGNFDAYITSWAEGLKAHGRPVLLRFAHEMNYRSYPWSVGANGNTADSFVAAWRHVHEIFSRLGARNVAWVWSPGVKHDGTTPFASVYPGDQYVDWLALDGFNGGSALPWGGWLPFQDIFAPSHADLAQINGDKPMMIAETASVEQGGSKAAWISDALLTQLPGSFPRVKAFVWFNENRAGEADWRVDSTPESLAAYATAAANPYYGPCAPVGGLGRRAFFPIIGAGPQGFLQRSNGSSKSSSAETASATARRSSSFSRQSAS